MPPMVFYCCVPQCTKKNKDIKVHRFPVDTEVYQKWIRLIQREDLKTMNPEIVRRNYRVCDNHFSSEARISSQYYSQTGLVTGSLPSLNLPAQDPVGEDTVPESVPGSRHISALVPTVRQQHPKLLTVHANVNAPERKAKEDIAGPSHTLQPAVKKASERNSPSFLRTTPPVLGTRKCILIESINQLEIVGIRKGFNFLAAVNVTRSIQLTPKAKVMYNLAKNLKKTAPELDRENTNNRERLQKALESLDSGELFSNKINSLLLK